MVEPTSTNFSKGLSRQFSYSEEEGRRILAVCQPKPAWIDEFPSDVIEEMGSPESAVLRLLEHRADRFLNHEADRSASKVEQRQYLEALDYHLRMVQQLISGVTSIDATTADPFRFLERAAAAKGKTIKGWEIRTRIATELLPLQVFARWRLQNDLKPTDAEKEEESIKRRRTFPRFCLVADLTAAYQRITGKTPGASVHDGKPSEAVEFVCIAANPVLSFARQAPMDFETAKKEIGGVKALWRKGVRPEQTYVQPDWGKHKWPYDVGI